jgi:molybdenum cofactor cytidylyltransferase
MIAGLLICAGLSERYGAADKMLADLEGTPLALHAAQALAAAVPWRIAVIRGGQRELAARLAGLDFTILVNPRPQDGQDSSIRIGLAEALAAPDMQGVLLCLGDMPRITPDHLHALAASDPRPALCVHDGVTSPPAWFPRALAVQIMAQADRPIHGLVRQAGPVLVPAAAAALADVDTPADLRHVRAYAAHDGR